MSTVDRFSVAVDQLEARVRLRLAGDATADHATVAWGDVRDTIVLVLSSLKVRLTEGWMICNVDAGPPGARPSTLQIVYFLGGEGDLAGIAAASENANRFETVGA
jgi:hypothetical protein